MARSLFDYLCKLQCVAVQLCFLLEHGALCPPSRGALDISVPAVRFLVVGLFWWQSRIFGVIFRFGSGMNQDYVPMLMVACFEMTSWLRAWSLDKSISCGASMMGKSKRFDVMKNEGEEINLIRIFELFLFMMLDAGRSRAVPWLTHTHTQVRFFRRVPFWCRQVPRHEKKRRVSCFRRLQEVGQCAWRGEACQWCIYPSVHLSYEARYDEDRLFGLWQPGMGSFRRSFVLLDTV